MSPLQLPVQHFVGLFRGTSHGHFPPSAQDGVQRGRGQEREREMGNPGLALLLSKQKTHGQIYGSVTEQSPACIT